MMGAPANGLALGIVVASYPQGMSVDVLMPDSGSRLTNVQVMLMGGASDKSGTAELPDPGLPADDTRWNLNQNAPNIIYAVLGSYKGIPVCLGFLLPQVCQMTFPDKNRRVARHISDVYTNIDQYGNTELYHPSGSFVRIGTSSAHEDLTGKDFDGLWKIANNLTAAVAFHAQIANNGAVKATIDVDSSGNLTVTCTGNLSATVSGASGATITAASGINLNGVTIDSSGNVVTNGNVTSKGKVLATHVHSGVTAGGADTGAPV